MIFYTKNQKKLTLLTLALYLCALMCLLPGCAQARQAKFGPYAAPITEKTGFLRNTPAPDYWRMSQFYLPQQTSSACGLASVAMTLNFLIGVPKFSDQTLITQNELLETVFTGQWADRVAEGGDGLMFDDLVRLAQKALDYYKLKNKYTIEVIHLADTSLTLAELRQILAANEQSDQDMLLVYYNQGVLTSDWDGPHISPVGAYDASTRQVLMMDVDRDWYPPYWSTADKLLEAMKRPAPIDQGILTDQIGGLLWFKKIKRDLTN